MRHLDMCEKRLIYQNQTSLRHLFRNELNTEYFTCIEMKDIFNIFIYGFEYNSE